MSETHVLDIAAPPQPEPSCCVLTNDPVVLEFLNDVAPQFAVRERVDRVRQVGHDPVETWVVPKSTGEVISGNFCS